MSSEAQVPGLAKILPVWVLRSADSDGAHRFRLRSGAVKTLGRAPRADFIVDAPLVSRIHCRITASDEHLDVVDLKSTNGTYVNDKRVRHGLLEPGDRLRLGRVELLVEKTNRGER